MTRIVIGRVVCPFGNKGELKVLPLTDWICRFLLLEGVCLERRDREPEVFEVEAVRYHARHVILKVRGVGSIDGAERLRDCVLTVSEEELPMLPPDHFWVHQVVGLEVLDEFGGHIGVVKQVIHTGANDVYIVDTPRKEVLIPATREVVKSVDVGQGRMIIRPLPGLLE